MTADIDFRLGGTLGPSHWHRRFQQHGRAHIPDLLTTTSAQALFNVLSDHTPWQLALNAGSRHRDLPAAQLALMPPAHRQLVSDAMTEQARHGFQYCYENHPIHDIYEAGHRDHPLLRLHEFLNGAAFLDCVRTVTGLRDIAFADSQATRFSSGHFLTSHDDDVAGKRRLAAYVLSMTPQWRTDWGGILQFIDADGHVSAGIAPRFNALNIFKVPQLHSVSFVTPSAPCSRYSITGWLRAR